MLSVLTVILLLIVFAVLLVLFAAIDVVFDVKGTTSSVQHSVVVHWLLFSKKVSPTDESDKDESNEIPEVIKDAEKVVTEKVTGYFEEEKKEKDKKKKKSIDISFSEILQAFRQLKSPVFRLLKGLIHAVKVPYARVNAVYGFPDPSYTGIVCGYSYAVMSYLACNFRNLSMQLEPDFVDSRFDLDMSGKIRIRPYRFVPVLLLFILNLNVLRFSWNFFIKKKSKKTSVNL
jgi:hypothetical protein